MTNPSPVSVKAGTAKTNAADYWIAGAARDLPLIVATPLLVLPAVLLARAWWSDGAVILFIAAFGQLGHNLPGMMRAYGDRELFSRYQIRFIVAPIALICVCAFGVFHHLHGLILISAVWAIWHAFMQTHGFARIYDAKVNSRDSLTRWLDFAFVLVWFGGVIVLCDQPASLLLSHYYNSGGPTVPAGWLAALRTLWLTGMILISAAFVAQSIRIWRQGRPANPVKFLLLSISIAFYWFAYSGAEHILVGAAMFDVFHDVQYLTIVWLFNRRRAASAGLAVGPFTRFVFGRSGALIGVYLGLIFAFGGIRYLETFAASPRAADMLNGFIAAMGLLHYYYDGFIWKLRDHDNRSALGITSTSTRTRRLDFMWPAHGAKWLLFAVPLVLLFWTQAHRKPDEIARAGALAETIPQSSTVQLDYARALENAAARRLARDQYARVLELDPTSIEAHRRTGGLCVSLGETTSGVRHLRRALQIDSTDLESRSMLGRALFKTGDFAAAEDELRQAAAIDSHSAVTVGDYGMALVATGKLAEAERVLRDALRRAPNSPQLHFQLGNALFRQGRRDDASAHFHRALELDPRLSRSQRPPQLRLGDS